MDEIDMNWIDYTILGIIFFSSLISVSRGFVREALSLLIWFGAFFIARSFYPLLALHLHFQDETIRNAASIAILFVSTLVVGAAVNNVMGHLVSRTGLSGTDRVLGIVFGAVRGILIVSAIVFFLDAFTQFSDSSVWRQSELIPQLGIVIKWFFAYISQNSSLLPQFV